MGLGVYHSVKLQPFWCFRSGVSGALLTITTMSAQWKHGLFGCFDDIKVCCWTYAIPCYVHGKNAETVEEGSCLKCGLAMCVPGLNLYARVKVRGMIREKAGIEGSCCDDLLKVWFCHVCALTQEANEVDSLGPVMRDMVRQ